MMMLTPVTAHSVITGNAATASFAAQRRRESRREEWSEHIKLAALLTRYLDPKTTFWTSLENKPISRVSGFFQRQRGVRAGIPDLMVLARGLPPVFLELKSVRGVPSAAQKKIAAELVAVDCSWYLVRSARAALTALHLEGVTFRRKWKLRRLRNWEGPFSDPAQRLPQHPRVAAERAAARKRWRARQRVRQAVTLASTHDDAAGDSPTHPPET